MRSRNAQVFVVALDDAVQSEVSEDVRHEYTGGVIPVERQRAGDGLVAQKGASIHT